MPTRVRAVVCSPSKRQMDRQVPPQHGQEGTRSLPGQAPHHSMGCHHMEVGAAALTPLPCFEHPCFPSDPVNHTASLRFSQSCRAQHQVTLGTSTRSETMLPVTSVPVRTEEVC